MVYAKIEDEVATLRRIGMPRRAVSMAPIVCDRRMDGDELAQLIAPNPLHAPGG